MSSVLRISIMLTVTMLALGCGGQTSMNDLKRMAMSRKSDEDEDEAPATVATNEPSAAVEDADTTAPNTATPVTKPVQDPQVASSTDIGAGSSTESTDEAIPVIPTGPVEETEEAYLDRMNLVGSAFAKYMAEKSSLPSQSIKSTANQPLLSWRVQLLPYMGYGFLYSQFVLDEPWDSPQNLSLLEKMPKEFYTGSAKPGHTCLQVPVDSYTAFNGQRTVFVRRVEDGIGNTVLGVVTTPELAVPWTKPDDYQPPGKNLVEGLNAFNDDHYLVLWGTGNAEKIRTDARQFSYRAMFTIDGGEDFRAPTLTYSAPTTPTKVAGNNTVPGAAANSAPESEGTPATTVADRGPSVSPGTTAARPSTGLSQDLMKVVYRRLEREEYDHTFDILDLAMLVEPTDQLPGQMRWLPAVSRPVVMPRVGIGIECPIGPRFRNDASPFRDDNSDFDLLGPGNEAIDELLGDYGQSTLQILVRRIDAGDWGTWPNVETNGRGRRSTEEDRVPVVVRPGIEYLGNNTRKNLAEIARKQGLDVLLFFEVQLKKTSRNLTHNTTTLTAYDVRTGKPIFEANPVNNIQVFVSRQNPLEKNPMEIALNDFDKWVRENLVLAPIPAMSPQEVRERMAAAAADIEDTSWNAALEARLYYQLGLVSRVEFSEWVTSFAGVDAQTLVQADKDELLSTLLETRDPGFARMTREALEEPDEEPVGSSRGLRGGDDD